MAPKLRKLHRAASDAERFEQLFELHHKAVLGFALRRSDSAEDAADALAETFTIAWRRLDSVPTGDSARWWLYATARHAIANAHRSARRRDNLVDSIATQLGQLMENDEQGAAETEDLAPEVEAALAALTEEEREVLTLHAWEGLKPREISEVLGLGRAAARTRLHRARTKFQAAFETHQVESRAPIDRISPIPREESS